MTDAPAHVDTDGTSSRGEVSRFLRERPHGDLGGILVLASIVVVAVAASAVEPRWIFGVGEALRRIGGVWRLLVLPLPVTLLVVALAANVRAPGSVWRWVCARPDRWWRASAVAFATVVALLGSALQLGITLTQLTRPVVLWVLQLVLHPQTPTAIVVTAALLAVVVADHRRFAVLPWVIDYVVSLSRAAIRRVRPALPVGAAMVASGIAAAALYPDAMQGWFRPDPQIGRAHV